MRPVPPANHFQSNRPLATTMRTVPVLFVVILSAVINSVHSGIIPGSDSVWSGIGNFNREPPPPPGPEPRLILNRKFTTKLDHFDDTNDSQWEMKYFSNDNHFVFGGPMFVFVGGDRPISYGWVIGGHVFDMAKDMSGTVFYTEHRYYGDSRPTPDVSTANLKYLTADQAIEDLALFIKHQKATVRGLTHSKVILIGTAYSGSLVTWFSQAYPELVDFAWASSAPLEAKLDFAEFKEGVAETIKAVGGDACYNRVASAFRQMEEHIDSGNREYLRNQFNLCNALSNTLDVWSFFSGLSNSLSLLVQTDNGEMVKSVCQTFTELPIEDDVEAFAALFRDDGNENCIDASYVTNRLAMGESDWSAQAVSTGARQWHYQACNEMGWFPTSNSPNQPFGSKFPLELNIQMCMDFFNSQFQSLNMNEGVDLTNSKRNGLLPEVQNVFFTHGEHDPWRLVGLSSDLNETCPVVVLSGYSHSQDLYSIGDSDSEQLKETKLRIRQIIWDLVGIH